MARQRKRRHLPEENHERWLVSYADFITLLFAFFIVLYATSERNSKKTAEFEKSIKKFFVNVTGAVGVGADPTIRQEKKGDRLIKSPLPTITTSSDEAAEVMTQVEVFIDEKLSEKERARYLLDLSHDAYGIRIALDASKLFTENSIQFERQSLTTLDTISFLLKTLGNNIVVESHVDHVANRPEPFSTDWKLSSSRSSQVVEYMIRRHGISSKRLAAMAHGSERPLFPKGDSSEKKNQRLEFLIVTEESPF